jgi:hypothetical protein
MFNNFTLYSTMKKTRKIQVTLEEKEYDLLAQIARQKGKKLAAIVRESIFKYSLQPETERAGRKALDDLFSLHPTPVPKTYQDWESRYHEYKKGERRIPS